MDTSYDKVISYLTEEQGLSLEEAEEIMVLCVEQGMDPTEIFGRGLVDMLGLTKQKKVEPKVKRATRIPDATGGAVTGSLRSGNLSFPGDRSGAYDAAKQNLSTPKVEVPKIKTPPQTGGLLGTRSVPTMTDLGAAPKPQFGPGSTNTGQSFPKPPTVTRDAGAFARQRLMTKPPSTATLSRGARLLRGLKGPVAVAAEIGADMALQPVAKAGGRALTRTILDITGQGNRARQVAPSLYGKAGPDFTPDIAKGIQQRTKLAQQSAETQAASQPKPQPTGERSAAANAEKQELAKAEAQRRREAAAPKPAPKPPTAQERAYGARSKLTAAQQELNRQYDIDRGLKDGRVTKPNSPALDKYLAKRKK